MEIPESIMIIIQYQDIVLEQIKEQSVRTWLEVYQKRSVIVRIWFEVHQKRSAIITSKKKEMFLNKKSILSEELPKYM